MDFQALFEKVQAKVVGWGNGLVEMVPNLVGALLVVLLFIWLARIGARLLGRGLGRFSSNKPIIDVLTKVARVAIVGVGLFIALGLLHLEKTVTSLLAGVGIIGLALGFAFQDIASNFMSGIIMAMRRPFNVGDLIETKGIFGRVERIDLRATTIRRPTGQLVLIPNKDVLQSPIENFDDPDGRRVDLEIGVSYGDDLRQAKRVAVEAVESLPMLKEGEKVELFFTGFGSSSIDFVARFWIDRTAQADYFEARSEAMMRIKEAFDEADITIPFPIRTLDFGIEGGVRLDEVLGSDGGKSAA